VRRIAVDRDCLAQHAQRVRSAFIHPSDHTRHQLHALQGLRAVRVSAKLQRHPVTEPDIADIGLGTVAADLDLGSAVVVTRAVDDHAAEARHRAHAETEHDRAASAVGAYAAATAGHQRGQHQHDYRGRQTSPSRRCVHHSVLHVVLDLFTSRW
jgi:hypothetical protein